jgi:pyruvate-ferredoxin/flavodoxin oxidoreductase
MRGIDENPFRMDSLRPTIPLKDYTRNEIRYTALSRSNPSQAEELLRMAQEVVTQKYHQYENLARRDGTRFHPAAEKVGHEGARPQ